MILAIAQPTVWTPGSQDAGNSLCLEGYGG
jgi:hypothetical protein